MTPQEIFITQNSEEWHKFRGEHCTASDTPIVIGESNFSSKKKLAEIKKGNFVKTFTTPAMENGHAEEHNAREQYGVFYEPMRPAVFKLGIFSASLDGLSKDGKRILEIKTPYKQPSKSERWAQACLGSVIKKDFYQVQHQLMVTKAESAHLLVWDHLEKIFACVKIKPCEKTFLEIANCWENFFKEYGIQTNESFKC